MTRRPDVDDQRLGRPDGTQLHASSVQAVESEYWEFEGHTIGKFQPVKVFMHYVPDAVADPGHLVRQGDIFGRVILGHESWCLFFCF